MLLTFMKIATTGDAVDTEGKTYMGFTLRVLGVLRG